MAVEVIAGPLYNALGRGVAYGATPSGPVSLWGGGTARTSFGLSGLWDGIPASPMIMNEVYSTYYLDIGVNLVQCGDGEQATAVGWTGSAATVATSATLAYKGAKSLYVSSSAAAGYASQVISVQAGEALGYHVALAGETAKLVIYDRNTCRYLAPGGTWQTGFIAVFSGTSASFTSATGTFTAPTASEWWAPMGDLEIKVYPSEDMLGGACYAEVLVYPLINFVGLFGHNVPPATTMSLTSYANWWHGGTATVVASSTTQRRPVAWISTAGDLAAPFYRFALVTAGGDPFESAWWGGELVLGRRRPLSVGADYPARIEMVHPQLRATTRGGTTWSVAAARYPTRQLILPFEVGSAAALELQDLALMTRGGQTPVVILPTDTHPNVCILGRTSERQTYSLLNFARQAAELVVSEEAFPSVG